MKLTIPYEVSGNYQPKSNFSILTRLRRINIVRRGG
jgi:hypothetical protein